MFKCLYFCHLFFFFPFLLFAYSPDPRVPFGIFFICGCLQIFQCFFIILIWGKFYFWYHERCIDCNEKLISNSTQAHWWERTLIIIHFVLFAKFKQYLYYLWELLLLPHFICFFSSPFRSFNSKLQSIVTF